MRTLKTEKRSMEMEYVALEIRSEKERRYSILYQPARTNTMYQRLSYLSMDDMKTLHRLIGEVIEEEGGRP